MQKNNKKNIIENVKRWKHEIKESKLKIKLYLILMFN
jgi:hypothetical protein